MIVFKKVSSKHFPQMLVSTRGKIMNEWTILNELIHSGFLLEFISHNSVIFWQFWEKKLIVSYKSELNWLFKIRIKLKLSKIETRNSEKKVGVVSYKLAI